MRFLPALLVLLSGCTEPVDAADPAELQYPAFDGVFRGWVTFDGPVVVADTKVYLQLASTGDGLLTGAICHYDGELQYLGQQVSSCEGATGWPVVEGVIDRWDGECFDATIWFLADRDYSFYVWACQCWQNIRLAPPEEDGERPGGEEAFSHDSSSQLWDVLWHMQPYDPWFHCDQDE